METLQLNCEDNTIKCCGHPVHWPQKLRAYWKYMICLQFCLRCPRKSWMHLLLHFPGRGSWYFRGINMWKPFLVTSDKKGPGEFAGNWFIILRPAGWPREAQILKESLRIWLAAGQPTGWLAAKHAKPWGSGPGQPTFFLPPNLFLPLVSKNDSFSKLWNSQHVFWNNTRVWI